MRGGSWKKNGTTDQRAKDEEETQSAEMGSERDYVHEWFLTTLLELSNNL